MNTTPKQQERPKKILYILPQPFLTPRGSSFRALATVKAITALGIEVDLLTYPIGKDVSIERLNLIRWWCFPKFEAIKIGPSFKKFLMDIPLFFKSAQLVLTNKYDLIHGPEEAGIMAAFFGKLLGIPYIYDMHSWMSQQIEEAKFIKSKTILKLFKKLEISCMHGARAIITVGPVMTEILKQLAPNVPAFTLKDCSLDIAQEVDSNLRTKLVQDFKLNDKVVFLYTGNFEIYQGIDLLLEAFAELRRTEADRFKNFTLLLVGGGAGQEDNIRKYKALVNKLELQDSVVFAGEWAVETMPTFMDIASVLVSPRTQGNNVPLKVYTYMASGKISVVTDINSHTQVLNPQNSIVAPAEPKQFAQALAHAASTDPSVQAELNTLCNAAKTASETRADQIEFRQVVKDCYSLL